MTDQGFGRPQQSGDLDGMTASELTRLVSGFEGPPEQFLQQLLKTQCQIASTRAGAILRTAPGGGSEIVAVHPLIDKGATTPVWLAQSVELAPAVLAAGDTVIKPLHGSNELYGQPAQKHLIFVPIHGQDGLRGLAVFLVETSDAALVEAARERLELSMSLLSLYEMRLMLQRREADLGRLRQATETLAELNEQERFKGAAMAFCNEVTARWHCERASLGFLKGRYVQLKATSHTEKFSRKMKLVQQAEAAMEECLDQDTEILFPSDPESTFVNRAAADLSRNQGGVTVLSLPLRHNGEPAAVLTLERPADSPFLAHEVESLRLACELCTARLVSLHDHDRWFGARAVAALRDGLAVLVGPKHTWVKLVALLILAAGVFLVFAKGDYRADAPFVIEAVERHVVPAPFDGFLSTVLVDPADPVQQGQTLATLDTAELKLERAAAHAEHLAYITQQAAAMRDGKIAEAQIARAQADKVKARIDLLDDRIRRADIVSPIDGSVLTGDLKRQTGAPVKTGDVLFEVAPLSLLRATLSVPEDQAGDITNGQEGELAPVSRPDQRIAFTVERINPVAEVVKGQNVFKVRVTLKECPTWLRPGAEGLAKVTIDRRHYAWIWTRRLVNWVRMKLWW